MRVVACKINHITNPVGYDLSDLRVSWNVVESVGKCQKKTRIQVSLDRLMDKTIYDSGWAKLDCRAQAIPIKLKPRTRYYYTVSVVSDAGEEAVSDICYFETSKEKEKWTAKWISCKDNGNQSPVFFKDIDLNGKVESARLYITGLGLYEVYYGDKKIGDEYLTPYCNDYSNWVQYQTFDVTKYLLKSDRLSVMLGNGWYKGRFCFSSKEKSKGHYGTRYLLLAELHISYKNGDTEVIGTDADWNVEKSNITFSNIYDGEHRDDTLSAKDKGSSQRVVCVKNGISKARLSARLSQPVKVIRPMKVKLIKTPKKDIILDVGQNITGGFKLKVKIKKGKKLKLSFGEVLQDGEFYRDNLRSAKAEYIYLSSGKETVIQPHFTFYGYRYVKVEGYDAIKAEDFVALPYSTELEETGKILTGNKLVNKLISNIYWSCKDNFVDVPTDCPQRDERMGWTGDAQAFSATATYLNDSYAFYKKYLYDMYWEQKKHKGGVPFTIPSFGLPAGSAVWGDAATIIPWTLYRFYGDRAILDDQYESMRSWVDFITSKDKDDCGWRKEFHFGDWLALDVPGADVSATSGATDTAFIADVYYMESAKIVADAAAILGKNQESKKYKALSEKIRNRIHEEFYSPNGRCCCDTQTGLVLTLRHHLADAEKTKERLRKKLKDNGYKLDCGFVGAPLLCMTLSENDMSDLAVKLLLNDKYPGWLNEVKLGATTVWERWNSLDENGHISSTGMNSLNHYAYGSILEWMFAYLAGIRPGDEGFLRAIIEPKPVYALKYVNSTYRSALGLWKSEWKVLDKNHVEIAVEVPFGAKADLKLPLAGKSVFNNRKNPIFKSVTDDICHLDAGSYRISYRTSQPIITNDKLKK